MHQAKSLTIDTVNWNASHVSSLSKPDFVKDNLVLKSIKHLEDKAKSKYLEDVYDKCVAHVAPTKEEGQKQ